VTRPRVPKLFEVVGVVAIAAALTACGASQPAVTQAPAASASAPPRRPDAVVVEPPAAMPPVVTRAEARGVVALRPSLSTEAVRDLVQSLVEAWQRGSLEGLAALLATDAGPIEARARGPGALQEAWRQRLRAREYKRLEGLELVRLDRIEHYAWAELGGPDAPPRPNDMRADEVYVRVPLEVTQVAGERYFDGVIVLMLRADEGRARIVAYGETP
jgi:hypothetical protein